MKLFEHGGKIFQAAADLGVDIGQIDDFSANINPLVDEQKLRQWSDGCWQNVLHYPDVNYIKLHSAIAKFHAVSANQVVVDNGATTLIHSVVDLLAVKSGRITAPTFGEYEKALRRVGATVDVVSVNEDLTIPLQKMSQNAEKYDIIFICTPNNPTGKQCEYKALIDFLEKLSSSTYCLVDESFIPFTAQAENASLSQVINRFKNLIVLRSATKFFGIPGLRIGYMLTSNNALFERLQQALPIWRVNAVAEQVVINALQDVDFHEQTRRYIAEQRDYLTTELRSLGFVVHSAEADYLLIENRDNLDLYHDLYHNGIIIRRCQNYRGLAERHYRIAVKDAAANQRLIAQLNKIKEKIVD